MQLRTTSSAQSSDAAGHGPKSRRFDAFDTTPSNMSPRRFDNRSARNAFNNGDSAICARRLAGNSENQGNTSALHWEGPVKVNRHLTLPLGGR